MYVLNAALDHPPFIYHRLLSRIINVTPKRRPASPLKMKIHQRDVKREYSKEKEKEEEEEKKKKKQEKKGKRLKHQQGNLVSLRWHFRERCPQILFHPRVFYVTTVYFLDGGWLQSNRRLYPRPGYTALLFPVSQLTLILIPAFSSVFYLVAWSLARRSHLWELMLLATEK